MKDLHGASTASTVVALEDCLALLAAIDRYPSWYPEVVREVTVIETETDGRPSRAEAVLHMAHGPLVKDFRVLLDVRVERPGTVKLVRVPHDGKDDGERFEVTWQLEARGETHIELRLDAVLAVPRFLPLGPIGDGLADGFVSAAVGFLEQST
jgi:hypothetical protein